MLRELTNTIRSLMGVETVDPAWSTAGEAGVRAGAVVPLTRPLTAWEPEFQQGGELKADGLFVGRRREPVPVGTGGVEGRRGWVEASPGRRSWRDVVSLVKRGGSGPVPEVGTCANCQFSRWEEGRSECRTGRCLSGDGTACKVTEGGLIFLDVPYRAGVTCEAWRERTDRV